MVRKSSPKAFEWFRSRTMIDCHCHLASDLFANDIQEVVQNAKDNGVIGCVVTAQFSSDFNRILELREMFPDFIYPNFGIHPIQSDKSSVSFDRDYRGVEEQIRRNIDKVYGIGEIGLDFSPRFLKNVDVDKENQKRVLTIQVELAKEFKLSVNVHSRSASRPVIELLSSLKAENVLLHAFDGSIKNAMNAIKLGYCFSIPPSFTLSEKTKQLVEKIPLNQLCLETDSPALGLIRGEKNEPQYIKQSAEFIAQVKKIPLDEVISITTQNAKRLFKIP